MTLSKDIEVGKGGGATESTPLVVVPSHNDTAADDDEPLGEIKECTAKEKIVSSAAVVASVASAAAMFVEKNPMVYLSGSAGLVVAPYAAFQQQKMTDVIALQETNERLGEEVDNLRVENDRLQVSVGELEKSVENLRDLEETLQTIKKSETKSIDALEKQVEEQREILKSMKGNLKATIMQNLITTVLNCDKDGDCILSDDEIAQLIENIRGLYGVVVKEDQFKSLIIGCGRSLNAVMEVCRNLLNDDIPEKDRIFVIKG